MTMNTSSFCLHCLHLLPQTWRISAVTYHPRTSYSLHSWNCAKPGITKNSHSYSRYPWAQSLVCSIHGSISSTFSCVKFDFWPSREVLKEHMPKHFGELFKNTRMILDATEIPVQKPSRVGDQSATFSTYKNRNTLKAMIGCNPGGLISYVSTSYGGCSSDRQIIERSPQVSEEGLLEAGDSIMADRGIMVQDLFACKNVHVNTPTMLKGKHQLEPETVVKDRRIASKRIHVERVIKLSRTLGGRIVYVCFMLSNFRRSIVNRLAWESALSTLKQRHIFCSGWCRTAPTLESAEADRTHCWLKLK